MALSQKILNLIILYLFFNLHITILLLVKQYVHGRTFCVWGLCRWYYFIVEDVPFTTDFALGYVVSVFQVPYVVYDGVELIEYIILVHWVFC